MSSLKKGAKRSKKSVKSKKTKTRAKAVPEVEPEERVEDLPPPETEFEASLPESTRRVLADMKRRGGRVPVMPEKAVSPEFRELGKQLRRIHFQLVDLEKIGGVSLCYCRLLSKPKEMIERVQLLLKLYHCRVYREYLWKGEDFLSAYVLEFGTAAKAGLFAALEQVAIETFKPVTEVRLPTNNPDRNRPKASEWGPEGGKGQEGVHTAGYPLVKPTGR